MSKIILGIDPDSKKHGVALYEDGKLIALEGLSLMGLYGLMGSLRKSHSGLDDVEVHIEDVNGVSAAFGARDKKANIHIRLKMAQSIGMCKQSQVEVERMLVRFHVVPVKHKISKMWKKDRKQFEKVTGWTGQSNEDTRSAAYFGWLGTNR